MTTAAEHVLDIARDLFAALVDGEPGHVAEWGGAGVDLTEPVHAWVDITCAHPLRATVTTDRGTAADIARALLALAPDEAVTSEDAEDALGEMANVIGEIGRASCRERVWESRAGSTLETWSAGAARRSR